MSRSTRTTIELIHLRVVVETIDCPRSSRPVIETTGESVHPGPSIASCGAESQLAAVGGRQ